MKRYADLHGDSGVVAYALLPKAIAVEFRSGAVYVYTADSAGPARLARMRRLATSGRGLSTYISRHAHDRYAEVHDDRTQWEAAQASRHPTPKA
ncbi:hypothetical protein [Luteimonas suaedae]|uniref:hypothetical protein n=1 Tax=Luteimonas suaedae TaxID=2605430 RepID=UPI0011F08C2C|nr:hypothetical protein [Luteimonas suaedae]